MQATLRLPGAASAKLRTPSPLLLLALGPMIVIALFVSVLVWISVQQGVVGTAGATYTLENYTTIFADPFVLRVMLNTVVFSISATCFALGIGLPIAWLVERTTLRGKTFVYMIMTLGLLIPGIYTAMGWTFIAHPRIGMLNTWLQDGLGLEGPLIDVATPPGMGFVQGLSLTPLAFILTVQVFRAMNPSLEEAAGVHGLSLLAMLRRVTLPLAMPGIMAAVIYIVTIGIATFDIPAILGLGNRIYLLSTFVYLRAHPPDSGLPQHGISAAVGVFMVLVAVGLTACYSRVLRYGHRYQVVTGKGYRPAQIPLGWWALPAWAFILLYAILSKLLPLLVLAFVAFTPYLALPSPETFALLSFDNFQKINWELVWRGLQNTVLLVLVVPPAVLLFAFCISWLIVRSRSRARYLLEFGAFLPHALPEVILAVGATLLALFVLRDIVPLYGSVWLIAAVYVISRLAFATRALNGALLQIHRELEEAAFAAGLSAGRTAWRVLVPLLRPTVLSVWIWSALLVYRELTVAVFLAAQDNITLPAVVWSYWFSGAKNHAAAISLLMILVLTPLVLLFWWFGRRSVVATE